jgi:hemolysin III
MTTGDMPATTSSSETGETAKPKLRGVLHQVAFFVSLFTGASVIWRAPTPGSRVIMVLYALSISSLFGVSALFHRRTWAANGRRRMRRADHSTIFLAIAGSYTAIAGISLGGWARITVLSIVWVGTAAGITLRQVWLDAPKWAIALPYVVVGWSALAVLTQLFHVLGVTAFALLMGGGAAYSAGAVVYAMKRPNPVPGTFGYHEVFHACTIVGATLHFIVISVFVLPMADPSARNIIATGPALGGAAHGVSALGGAARVTLRDDHPEVDPIRTRMAHPAM